MNATVTFNQNGTGTCLYTELIDLHSLGRLNISRATNIEFNNVMQRWEVKDIKGKTRFFAKTRAACLAWEQLNLGAT